MGPHRSPIGANRYRYIVDVRLTGECLRQRYSLSAISISLPAEFPAQLLVEGIPDILCAPHDEAQQVAAKYLKLKLRLHPSKICHNDSGSRSIRTACGLVRAPHCRTDYLKDFFTMGPTLASSQPEKSNSLPTFEECLEALTNFPAVQNGLISPEQAAYCSWWQPRLRTGLGSTSIVYNGIGPDLTTALLVSDAKLVFGVDVTEVRSEKLKYFLDHWETLEDSSALPPDRMPERWNNEAQTWEDDAKPGAFARTIAHKQQEGFYDASPLIDPWSIERLVIAELKANNVGPDEISLGRYGQYDHPSISFPWQFPGGLRSERTVVFLHGEAVDFLSPGATTHLPYIDGIYQKSAEWAHGPDFVRLGEIVRTHLKRNAWVLIGSFGAEDALSSENYVEDFCRSTGRHRIAMECCGEIEERMRTRHGDDYGWRLRGMRLTDSSSEKVDPPVFDRSGTVAHSSVGDNILNIASGVTFERGKIVVTTDGSLAISTRIDQDGVSIEEITSGKMLVNSGEVKTPRMEGPITVIEIAGGDAELRENT